MKQFIFTLVLLITSCATVPKSESTKSKYFFTQAKDFDRCAPLYRASTVKALEENKKDFATCFTEKKFSEGKITLSWYQKGDSVAPGTVELTKNTKSSFDDESNKCLMNKIEQLKMNLPDCLDKEVMIGVIFQFILNKESELNIGGGGLDVQTGVATIVPNKKN